MAVYVIKVRQQDVSPEVCQRAERLLRTISVTHISDIFYDIHIILYREVCCRFVREAARIVPELSGWYRTVKEESTAKGKGNTRLPGTNFLKMLYIVVAPVSVRL